MATQVLHVIRGSDREFVVRIVVQETGEPFDLTGASEIRALFRKDDDSVLTKAMTDGSIVILSACTGKMKITLNETDTASLKVGETQSFEVEIQIGSITSIVQFIEVFTVIDRIFS